MIQWNWFGYDKKFSAIKLYVGTGMLCESPLCSHQQGSIAKICEAALCDVQGNCMESLHSFIQPEES